MRASPGPSCWTSPSTSPGATEPPTRSCSPGCSTLLRELAWHLREGPGEHREAVAEQLARVRTTVAAQDFDATERTRLAGLGVQVEQALLGRWEAASGWYGRAG